LLPNVLVAELEGATDDPLSPAARRAIDAIERVAREQLSALGRSEALDVLEIARERLLTIESEEYGFSRER
jgi:hypothetical protein